MRAILGLRVRRTAIAALVILAAVAVAGGVAYATIPDGNGVYTACRLNATGTIRLIDPSLPAGSLLGHCTALETQFSWNKGGPTGPPGPPGPAGATGPAGPPSPQGA